MNLNLILLSLLFNSIQSLHFFNNNNNNNNNNDDELVDPYHYFVLELEPNLNPLEVANILNLEYQEPMISLPNHFIYRNLKEINQQQQQQYEQEDVESLLQQQLKQHQLSNDINKRLISKGIIELNQQSYSKVYKRFGLHFPLEVRELKRRELQVRQELNIMDPDFGHQWHLLNKRKKGHDLNVIPVWEKGYTGKNVTVAFIDDGIDFKNPEFEGRYEPNGSYDFNDNKPDPLPKKWDDFHGTRCAGEVSAGKDNLCGIGIAYDSKVSGIRALSGPLLSHAEANALGYRSDINDIYSCSWGPRDDGKSMGEPPKLAQKSLIHAIKNGRNGLGSLYVFASGNGGLFKDNCNFDGYVNSIYTIAVGAISSHDEHPMYSEGCSALLTCAYSGDSHGRDTIFTSDNNGKCTKEHSGTSAAGPLVSGVLALVLEARNDLSWRDIQHLIIQNSVPVDLKHPSWDITYSGRRYSNVYGYGKIDADKIINSALSFEKMGEQTQINLPLITLNLNIPESQEGLIIPFIITNEMIKQNNFNILEHITITLNLNHLIRKDIEVDLISPNNIKSNLIETRPFDESKEGFPNWTVMTVKHFNEPLEGTWKLIIRDIHKNYKLGFIKDFKATFYGSK